MIIDEKIFQAHAYKFVDTDLFTLPADGTLIQSIQFLLDQCMPGEIKMKLTGISPETGTADIPFSLSNRGIHGLMHGGCFFTVGDTLTAFMCMYHIQEEGKTMLTQNASIRYLRPVRKSLIKAQAILKSKAENKIFYVCDFYNEEGKKVAQAKYKYVITKKV